MTDLAAEFLEPFAPRAVDTEKAGPDTEDYFRKATEGCDRLQKGSKKTHHAQESVSMHREHSGAMHKRVQTC